MFRVMFRPRHPLARLLAGVLAVLAVAAVLALGVFALAAFVVGGLLLWGIRTLRAAFSSPRGVPPEQPSPGVIDGEFTVVRVHPRRPVT